MLKIKNIAPNFVNTRGTTNLKHEIYVHAHNMYKLTYVHVHRCTSIQIYLYFYCLRECSPRGLFVAGVGFETRYYIKCCVINVAYMHVASINCTVKKLTLGLKYLRMRILNNNHP